MATLSSVLDYLKQNQQRSIDQLCEYVRFPSISAQPQHKADVHACAQWVVNHCREIGLDARLCPTEGNPIVIAQARAGISSALDTGHSPPSRRPHFLIYDHS